MVTKTVQICSISIAALLYSCIQTNTAESDRGLIGATSCNECHSYPGSAFCKTDTLSSLTNPSTQCFTCHNGAIEVDSTLDPSSDMYIYHDKMFKVDEAFVQRTGPEHADGMLSLNFTECGQCHSFPPRSGLHTVHVIDNGKNCFECHLESVKYDTLEYDGVPFLEQLTDTVPGGNQLPVPDTLYHINNKYDISFKKNSDIYRYTEIINGDTFPPVPLFRFDPFDKSCSDIDCHSGPEFGGAPIDRSIWKDSAQ